MECCSSPAISSENDFSPCDPADEGEKLGMGRKCVGDVKNVGERGEPGNVALRGDPIGDCGDGTPVDAVDDGSAYTLSPPPPLPARPVLDPLALPSPDTVLKMSSNVSVAEMPVTNAARMNAAVITYARINLTWVRVRGRCQLIRP